MRDGEMVMKRLTLAKVAGLPFPIEACCIDGDRIFAGCIRNSSVGVEENSFRCFTPDWEQVWKLDMERDPCAVVSSPSGVFGVTWGIRSRRGELIRMEPRTGDVVWRRQLRAPCPSPQLPVLLADQVCVVQDWQLCSFRLNDGKLRWTHEIDVGIYPSIAMAGGRAVIVGRRDGTVARLDVDRGEVTWARNVGGVAPVLCRYGEQLFAADSRGGALLELDTTSGRILKEVDVEVWSSIHAESGCLFFQSFHDNEEGYRFAAVDVKDMRKKWDVDVPFSRGNATFSPYPVGIIGDGVIVATAVGPLYALDVASGKMTWQLSADDLKKYDPGIYQLRRAMIVGSELYVQAGNWIFRVGGRGE